ncbi:unnamed protein product [Brachionus calyciflorus]|uniref:DNA-directed DNA polymerase n=1 Tax=Brachionus calyciflorus TaxID=104777 RepID=A0A813ZRD9_9BILA|nr:unnamed protein product [Brachionus calyciflorus]
MSKVFKPKSKKHVCGQLSKWCRNCAKSVEMYHRCFIKPGKNQDEEEKFDGFIFFDYEAYVDNGVHVPNLVMAQKVCIKCLNSKERCIDCNQYISKENNSFCEWLFKQENYIAVAHNLKGYDGVFILNYILSSFIPTDSYPTVSLTGFFPHHFNLPENQSYCGQYPNKKYYGSDFFSAKKKLDFDNWYDTPESIGIIPENGFHPKDRASAKSLMWLKYLSEKHNLQIRHSKNYGEVRVGKYKLDGYSEQSNTYYLREPLNPRDALFGGRTNSAKLNHKVIGDERVRYVDITSLYPLDQKYCEYPIGHPEIITENFDKNIENYFGIIKCKVRVPRNLYFPVLPARINNKLLFSLCKKCAEEQCQNCNHTDNERSFEATKTGGLFSDYVNMFYLAKQEAVGFPAEVVTDEQKDIYINNIFEKEGIRLEKDKIQYNSGFRSAMKLLLNSLWGRFGMNTNKTQYKIISDPAEWFEMIYSINNSLI